MVIIYGFSVFWHYRFTILLTFYTLHGGLSVINWIDHNPTYKENDSY